MFVFDFWLCLPPTAAAAALAVTSSSTLHFVCYYSSKLISCPSMLPALPVPVHDITLRTHSAVRQCSQSRRGLGRCSRQQQQQQQKPLRWMFEEKSSGDQWKEDSIGAEEIHCLPLLPPPFPFGSSLFSRDRWQSVLHRLCSGSAPVSAAGHGGSSETLPLHATR